MSIRQQGKRPGAYMSPGAFDVHPYLLLNHNDDYESLSTLAHEWGHAMHTLYSKQNAAIRHSVSIRPLSRRFHRRRWN